MILYKKKRVRHRLCVLLKGLDCCIITECMLSTSLLTYIFEFPFVSMSPPPPYFPLMLCLNIGAVFHKSKKFSWSEFRGNIFLYILSFHGSKIIKC